jgi:hypothetical protein
MGPDMRFNSEEGSNPSTNQKHYPMSWIRSITIHGNPPNPAEGNLPIGILGEFADGEDGYRD